MNIHNSIRMEKSAFRVSRDRIFSISLSLFLFAIMVSNIKNIFTVWEIYDEACYLFNASLFGRVNWKDTFAYCQDYYGWGYSVLLIPLFWICSNGIQLIRGAIITNYLLVIVCYYQLNRMIRRLLNSENVYLSSVISFAFCLYPYVFSNANKVTCEVCVFALFLLLCNCIINLLESESLRWYIVLAVLSSYLYAVHARTIVVLLVTWFFVGLMCVINKRKYRSVFIGIFLTILFFFVVKEVKSYFLGFYNQKSLFESEGGTNNLFDQSFFRDRIIWFATSIPLYLLGGIVKYVYLIVCSCGLVTFGLYDSFKSLFVVLKKKEATTVDWFRVFVFLAFCAMICACVMSGLGGDFRYLIYGRYYEYTSIPMIIFGLVGVCRKVYSKRCVLVISVINISLIFLSWRITDYIPSNSLGVDTNRLAGITSITSLTSEYIAVLLWGTIITIFVGAYLSSAQNFKFTGTVVCTILMLTFMFSDHKGLDAINRANLSGKSDWRLLSQNISDEEQVYFIVDQTCDYWTFYTRLQVLLYKTDMNIIYYDDIEGLPQGACTITMTSGEAYLAIQDEDFTLIDVGHHFAVFEKGNVGEEG